MSSKSALVIKSVHCKREKKVFSNFVCVKKKKEKAEQVVIWLFYAVRLKLVLLESNKEVKKNKIWGGGGFESEVETVTVISDAK